ncbi:glycosyltransferase family 4 protein [Candidatus Chloroploca sp. Khr17]|uniref:glycosyltransferase family 4 protein n=1 Tax=Candidatus Chloroploca sp. Khr17 TaxID=2496869 RepID=UPI0013EA6032|nr:glycosyltransferase family 4 protein [Candidatus Chloroploca sp. Khr17]
MHLIDPSNFTPHYCIGLGNGLRGLGLDVHLWASDWPYDALGMYPQQFVRHDSFFKLSTALNLKQVRVKRIVKGLEYASGFIPLLRQTARNRRRTIVHSQWVVVPAVDRWIWRRLQKQGTPIFYTAHNVLPHDHKPADVQTYRWFYAHADQVIVHAPSNKAEFAELYPDLQQKVQVVRFGEFGSFLDVFPDVGRLEARNHFGFAEDDQVALFFGNIAPYKGLDLLIEAVGRVAERMPKLKLLIAGNCSDQTEIQYQNLIRQHGLEQRVVFHRRHIATELNKRYFASSDVCVLPYRSASQSMALFMAMANKQAVLVTRTGGLADTVDDGQDGLVVEPGSVDALVQGLQSFFAMDVARQAAMGARGFRKMQEEHSWPVIAGLTRDLYETHLGHQS